VIQRVLCYGTVWIVPVTTTEDTALAAQPSSGASHLTSPGLDSSFVFNLFVHSTGITYKELLTAKSDRNLTGALLRRVGGSPHTSSRTYHLYDCGETYCQSVSTLMEERIGKIAANWNAIYRTAAAPAHPPPRLVNVLTQLVELARTAVSAGAGLRLRVDYRGKEAKPSRVPTKP
jgi:hypothetical protein